MEFHEIANIFPMMTGEDYQALRDDITSNGLLEPITLYEGKILDGRNRYTACLDAGIELKYREYGGGDPVGFVVSMNINRRHLTTAQKSFIGVEIKRIEAIYARERQGSRTDINFRENIPESERGRARDKAAQAVGINPKYIDLAEKLSSKAPDIANKALSGEWSMNRAKNEYNRRKKREEVKAFVEKEITLPPLERIYNVFYADPPWQYSSNAIDKHGGVAENFYSTLPLNEIKDILNKYKIKMAKDAVLFLWTTNPFLEKSFQILDAWGFEYKTNIVWVKTELKKPGVGYYVRGRHELLFIATRGSFTPLDKSISPPIGSVLQSPIREHSRKPDEVYEIIERLYPDCAYFELFARNKREGWDSIGDEIS